jgi:hypothetical protein
MNVVSGIGNCLLLRRTLLVAVVALFFAPPVFAAIPYRVGEIVGTNFGFQNRYLWTNDNGQVFTPSNTVIRLSDFAGKIVMFEFFAVWCGNCQGAIGQMTNGIRDYYRIRNGTSNGIPVAYVVVNLERSASFQGQTDAFLAPRGVRICGNDYTATNTKSIRGLFGLPAGVPGGSPTNGPDPRPLYVIINCVSNSPSHAQWQILENHIEPGGGAEDYSVRIAAWRRLIDSVQAPPPRITGARYTNDAFEFTIPGQRGRTNRVERTTDFANWTSITNVFGTNAPVRVRDPDATVDERRFYRVVRP